MVRETLTELLDSLAAGRIKPVVAERIPLAEAARAHENLTPVQILRVFIRIVYANTHEPGVQMRRLTIDQLAAEVELPTSTIRMYRHRGLIEPPLKEGRQAFYNERQVEQLALIRRLKERGYSLAAIGELVALWRAGEPLEPILGDALPTATELTAEELFQALFPDGEIEPEVVAKAASLGLIELGEDGFTVRDARELAIGTELVQLGIPSGEVLDEYERLLDVTRELAIRFADLFEEYLLPHDTNPAQSLETLVSLARSVVDVAVMRSLREEGQRRLTSA